MNLATTLKEYFRALDEALEKLTEKKEDIIPRLPPWVLSYREVSIGITQDGNGTAFKILPQSILEEDVVNTRELSDEDELALLLAPMELNISLRRIRQSPLVMMGGMVVFEKDNPLSPLAVSDPALYGYGSAIGAQDYFTIERAKKDAIDFVNKAVHNVAMTDSFVIETKKIFSKFVAIIKRKAFLERRIHRYLYAYAYFLLPSHRQCLYEHRIHLDDEYREADFILEREAGFPSILIELESPAKKIFRRNGELTADANHAKAQIFEWVAFIEKDARRNASGEFAFLSGPKERLVIMGRGLDNKDKMLSTKFQDTLIWSYDLLLEQAKSQWNDTIEKQCKLVGLDAFRPF